MKESVTCNLSTCDSPKANSYNPEFMKEAIRIAVENVENGTGALILSFQSKRSK